MAIVKVKRPFILRMTVVVTHNGKRPIGTLLQEVHTNDVPRIKQVRYVTITEPAPKGEYHMRYRRVYFHCGCVGQRPDGPKRFIPSED